MTYEEILEYVLSAGSNSLNVFGGRFEGGYQLQQVPEEISKMIFELKQNNVKIENYCEIGAAAHGLTRLMVELFNIKRVLTIDLDNEWLGKKENLEVINNKCKFSRICQDSHTIGLIDTIKNNFTEYLPFDFIVIDVDHSYEGVKQDWDMMFPYVNHGGYLMLHDTENIPDMDVNQFKKDLETVSGLPEAHFYTFGHYKETNQYKGIGIWRKWTP